MALKKPSQAAKAADIERAADALADKLADKPYGESAALGPVAKRAMPAAPQKNESAAKARAISVSLPPEIIEQLEDLARENKRAGVGPKTISGILREILENAGYAGATFRNR